MTVEAKSYNIQDNYYGGSCSVIIEKNKVYYSVTETGRIYCYDMKSKNTKVIADAKGKGFYGIKKKGNYIYAVFDSYSGSDGNNNTIVRVSIKNGKKKKLAKGCNFVLAGKKIYFTKTKRVKDSYLGHDEPIGVYSMTLDGKKQKKAKNVELKKDRDEQSAIKSSKGSLATKGYMKNGYYFSQSLVYTGKNGKSTVLYDIAKDKGAASYSTIHYYTLQGNYVVYKRLARNSQYGTVGQLVLVKTNGKDERLIYSKPSVSGW